MLKLSSGAGPNIAAGDDKFCRFPQLKTDLTHETFVTNDNAKFPDIAAKTIVDHVTRHNL
jgi:hypothetical protein